MASGRLTRSKRRYGGTEVERMDEGVPLLGWVRSNATRRGRRYNARRAVAMGALPPPGGDGLEDEAVYNPT